MAKHLLWFKPLKGLLLAICLSILTALSAVAAQPPAAEASQPSPDSIKVLQPSIVIPTGMLLYFDSLIKNGVVEGVPGGNTDYIIESSTSNNVNVNSNSGYIIIHSPRTAIVTYTHKEFPEVKFSIEVTAENSPAQLVQKNIGTLYIGKSTTLTIPDDYLSLSDFTLKKYNRSNDQNADFSYSVDGNQLTLEGIAEGRAYLDFSHKFGTSTATFDITTQPSPDSIKVLQPSIVIPKGMSLYLSSLISNGVVEGVPGGNADYTIEPSVTQGVTINSNYNYISISTPLSTTVTYTNKEFPDLKFSIEVTAKNSPAEYVASYCSALYVDKARVITIPDDYLPLSEFTLSNTDWSNAEFEVKGNQLTIIGRAEGRVCINFTHKFGGCSAQGDVIRTPLSNAVKAKSENYYVPWYTNGLHRTFSLTRTLISNGEIEGVLPTELWNYVPTCDDPRMEIQYDKSYGYTILPTETGSYHVRYTNCNFPEITFDVTYIFKKCIDELFNLLPHHINPIYVGERREVQFPDDYIPLSAYTVLEVGSERYPNAKEIASIEKDLERNTLIITGLKQGGAWVHYQFPVYAQSPYQSIGFSVIVVEKPTVEEEPEVDENGEGEILSGLNQKVKIVVPKEIAEAAGDQPLIWKSSNEDIATIDENGLVNPSALGRTIITASIENAASRSAETTVLMTIEFWVTGLVADVPATLTVGSTAQASYMVDAGADEYTKSINAEWESSDPSVVEIDSDGNMTAVAEGQATITLTTDIGRKTAIVTVVAESDQPKTISISPADVGLTVGNKLKLSAQGANGREVVWTTSNSFAVQVDGEGWLTAIAPGSATVTATIAGTTISSSVYVTVFERTTGIEETELTEPRVMVKGNTVTVEGVADDVPVEIYNVAGSLIAARRGSCAIAIGESGIYLVRVGSMVRKVAVKR